MDLPKPRVGRIPTMTAACATVGANSSIQRRRSRARRGQRGVSPARTTADPTDVDYQRRRPHRALLNDG